jgi:hypothetical protein
MPALWIALLLGWIAQSTPAAPSSFSKKIDYDKLAEVCLNFVSPYLLTVLLTGMGRRR